MRFYDSRIFYLTFNFAAVKAFFCVSRPFYLIFTQISVYKRTEIRRGPGTDVEKLTIQFDADRKTWPAATHRPFHYYSRSRLRNNEFIFVPHTEMNLKNDVRSTGRRAGRRWGVVRGRTASRIWDRGPVKRATQKLGWKGSKASSFFALGKIRYQRC